MIFLKVFVIMNVLVNVTVFVTSFGNWNKWDNLSLYLHRKIKVNAVILAKYSEFILSFDYFFKWKADKKINKQCRINLFIKGKFLLFLNIFYSASVLLVNVRYFFSLSFALFSQKNFFYIKSNYWSQLQRISL